MPSTNFTVILSPVTRARRDSMVSGSINQAVLLTKRCLLCWRLMNLSQVTLWKVDQNDDTFTFSDHYELEWVLALLLITDDGIDNDTHWDTNRLSESSYTLLMFCMWTNHDRCMIHLGKMFDDQVWIFLSKLDMLSPMAQCLALLVCLALFLVWLISHESWLTLSSHSLSLISSSNSKIRLLFGWGSFSFLSCSCKSEMKQHLRLHRAFLLF